MKIIKHLENYLYNVNRIESKSQQLFKLFPQSCSVMIVADTLSAYRTECVSRTKKKMQSEKILKMNSFFAKTEVFIVMLGRGAHGKILCEYDSRIWRGTANVDGLNYNHH